MSLTEPALKDYCPICKKETFKDVISLAGLIVATCLECKNSRSLGCGMYDEYGRDRIQQIPFPKERARDFD